MALPASRPQSQGQRARRVTRVIPVRPVPAVLGGDGGDRIAGMLGWYGSCWQRWCNGEQGAQGENGTTGEQGPKGDRGDAGARGEKGPPGPAGPQDRPVSTRRPSLSVRARMTRPRPRQRMQHARQAVLPEAGLRSHRPTPESSPPHPARSATPAGQPQQRCCRYRLARTGNCSRS